MKIKIKDLQVSMDLANDGIQLAVNDNKDEYLGSLYVGKAHVIWCKGKTQKANGVKKTWADFITAFDAPPGITETQPKKAGKRVRAKVAKGLMRKDI